MVSEMELGHKKLKEVLLKERGRLGVIRNPEELHRRPMNKFSAKTYGAVSDNDAAYLASKAHRAHLIQVEISKSRALAEAYRSSIR
jgi:hypothetical protein